MLSERETIPQLRCCFIPMAGHTTVTRLVDLCVVGAILLIWLAPYRRQNPACNSGAGLARVELLVLFQRHGGDDDGCGRVVSTAGDD